MELLLELLIHSYITDEQSVPLPFNVGWERAEVTTATTATALVLLRVVLVQHCGLVGWRDYPADLIEGWNWNTLNITSGELNLLNSDSAAVQRGACPSVTLSAKCYNSADALNIYRATTEATLEATGTANGQIICLERVRFVRFAGCGGTLPADPTRWRYCCLHGALWRDEWTSWTRIAVTCWLMISLQTQWWSSLAT
jgi:hypothetical protein